MAVLSAVVGYALPSVRDEPRRLPSGRLPAARRSRARRSPSPAFAVFGPTLEGARSGRLLPGAGDRHRRRSRLPADPEPGGAARLRRRARADDRCRCQPGVGARRAGGRRRALRRRIRLPGGHGHGRREAGVPHGRRPRPQRPAGAHARDAAGGDPGDRRCSCVTAVREGRWASRSARFSRSARSSCSSSGSHLPRSGEARRRPPPIRVS